ncbi:MAG: superoxide dismutase family protein [Planctomycetota bacterium]
MRTLAITALFCCVALLTAAESDRAVAVLHGTAGNEVGGTVVFTEVAEGVRVEAHVTGLSANGVHAIHIHEYGDATAPDGTSAGGHYNPAGHPHALPDEAERHAGDLGNLTANDSGVATKTLVVDNISIAGHDHPIIGRAVIVHAKRDTGGQPTGEAGARIGIGVIGLAPSE